jgi:enolase
MFNVINGGKHADSGLSIQEFMLAPVGWDHLSHQLEAVAATIAELKKILHARGQVTSVGDEGGFAPRLASNEAALDLLVEAITAAGYSTAQMRIGLDIAATTLVQNGTPTAGELIAWYERLLAKYPIISLEDGLAEDDWDGFALLNQRWGNRLAIVGDDLLVTNSERIKLAAAKQAVNTVLIKPNQVGTVSEVVAAVRLTKECGWSAFASHRSGETTDTFIADLAVGLGCRFIKAGSLARGERVCKYNRLLDIAAKLSSYEHHQ